VFDEEIEPCLRGRHNEWSQGSLFNENSRGNRTTYTAYVAGGTVDILTMRNHLVGTATFGEIENGEVTINIDLQGAKFSIGRESIRVLTYDDPPTGNPNFNPKLNTAREINATETTATIIVPAANYYAINLNVTCSDEED